MTQPNDSDSHSLSIDFENDPEFRNALEEMSEDNQSQPDEAVKSDPSVEVSAVQKEDNESAYEKPQNAEEVGVKEISEEEDGEQFEMLDLLCDQVEAEDFKLQKKQELDQMKKILDQRQQKRDLQVKAQQMKKLEKDANECVETYSQILLR